MKRRTTLKDLAKELNLAASTISRALDDHPGISPETKEKVLNKAEELGFTRNSIASSFRKNKTLTIGVIVPRIDIHFHSLVISGIEEFAYKAGYNVTIFQSRDSIKRETKITKILQNKMSEGVIICLGTETDSYEHFEKLNRLKIPLVFYDRVPSDYEANKIIINDYESAFKATEHLIEIGCKRIGHIGGSQSTGIFKDRYEGFKAALTKHGFPMDKKLVHFTRELSYEEGALVAKKLLNLENRPDGIFCSNDYTAVSAIQVFQKNNIKIPNEISIVGFSNYPISKIIEPHLTTVNDRAFEMGMAAARLLIRQIEEEEDIIQSEIVTIKTELIVRESTMRSS
ncbi:LacI family DNA-binding transcriptional regulator [Belliella kenyensis]|uniref:LacI family DNA-binding transcriptional regulator n=1 Tax=Belliella kenyensis TaxID=1472724 RepID=A0ABV8ER71_9BACT|nr:LacI family DNA-binding transcriptional regulator [Belliella kenyensis]MCH7402007.1 LacI family transcriptional regulator [Belliella kenyensis]MDN3605171.1 LacI family DNA-binding transcriptional regulator [Belliella kenyensis]